MCIRDRVKTGDPMNPVFWGLVLLVSVIVIAGGVVVYKMCIRDRVWIKQMRYFLRILLTVGKP